ncbi:MAG: hypothetical protein ETSY2_18240 [Candidatus Entotheonella gemina]|uniref:CRISPR type III-associated protein domain-containing protein n=1 Tax=Candidatus Entotheonella gemina TaxID=1429439 RepID=W4M7C8_9BACT|nr:MAG: hypothetical protein ETSY2_18240 [Candidatus Entotheonella gemina]
MAAYTFTIELTSDAEPGTGLGTNVIDDLSPRDHWHRPVIRASHVKGLMRDALREIIGSLGWDEAIEQRVFGKGDNRGPGIESAVRLKDAGSRGEPVTSLVTRTAVDRQFGVAYDKSLRTTEAIPIGTVFEGEVHCAADPDSAEDLAWPCCRLPPSGPAAAGAVVPVWPRLMGNTAVPARCCGSSMASVRAGNALRRQMRRSPHPAKPRPRHPWYCAWCSGPTRPFAARKFPISPMSM